MTESLGFDELWMSELKIFKALVCFSQPLQIHETLGKSQVSFHMTWIRVATKIP